MSGPNLEVAREMAYFLPSACYLAFLDSHRLLRESLGSGRGPQHQSPKADDKHADVDISKRHAAVCGPRYR